MPYATFHAKQNKPETYDEHKGDNIPSTVYNVHFPSDVSDTDGHDEHQKHTTIISTRVLPKVQFEDEPTQGRST
jgi:hypothetical protein